MKKLLLLEKLNMIFNHEGKQYYTHQSYVKTVVTKLVISHLLLSR